MIAHIIAFFIALCTMTLALDTRFTLEQAFYATAINMVLAHGLAGLYNLIKWLYGREWGVNLLNTTLQVAGVATIAVLAPLVVCVIPLLPFALLAVLTGVGRVVSTDVALHTRIRDSVKDWN